MEYEFQSPCYGTATISLPVHDEVGCGVTQDNRFDELFMTSQPCASCARREKRRQHPWPSDSAASDHPLAAALSKKCRVGVQSFSPLTTPIPESPIECNTCAPESAEPTFVRGKECCSGGISEALAAREVNAATKDGSRLKSASSSGSSLHEETLASGEDPLATYAANYFLFLSHHERLRRRRCKPFPQDTVGDAGQCAAGVSLRGMRFMPCEHCKVAEPRRLVTGDVQGSLAFPQAAPFITPSHSEERERSNSLHKVDCPETRIAGYGGMPSPMTHESENGERQTGQQIAYIFQRGCSDSRDSGHGGQLPSSSYCKLNAFLRELQFS